jgi:addiction module RelE/StbE family toxin
MKEINLKQRAVEQLGWLFRSGLVTHDDWQHLLYLLSKDEPLPPEYHEHRLTDNWEGHWECHLAGDLVVIYKRAAAKITLTAIGTHKELLSSRRRKSKGTKAPAANQDEAGETALAKATREFKRWWSTRR